MRNSRHRLLNKYRQAGGGNPGRTSDKFLVQEVMEEEWHSLQLVENCPEALVQVRQGKNLKLGGTPGRTGDVFLSVCLSLFNLPTSQPPHIILTAFWLRLSCF